MSDVEQGFGDDDDDAVGAAGGGGGGLGGGGGASMDYGDEEPVVDAADEAEDDGGEDTEAGANQEADADAGADVVDVGESGAAGGGEDSPDDPLGRVTTRYMTKYERARVLGARALQISMGAPVLADLEGETDPLMIALKELRAGKIPIKIRRHLPNNSFEDWNVNELIID